MILLKNKYDSVFPFTINITLNVKLVILLLFCIINSTKVNCLNPIIVHKNKFIDSITGKDFIIRGIDYYPRPNSGVMNINSYDYYTIENAHIWERDIQYMKQLNINAIRLYSVNVSSNEINNNHDAFMYELEKNNIYVIIALAHDCPTCAITSDTSPNCYPIQLQYQGQAIISAFSKYNNTLAYSAGNEVNHYSIPIGLPQSNAPCQKKFIYDMKQYQSTCYSTTQYNRPPVPIGLVSADNDRITLLQYYTTPEFKSTNNNSTNNKTNEINDNQNKNYEVADWYGLNTYVYCNGNVTSYELSNGFYDLIQDLYYGNIYNVPIILTEIGCISNTFPNYTTTIATSTTNDIISYANGTTIVDTNNTTTNNTITYENQRTFEQIKWILNTNNIINNNTAITQQQDHPVQVQEQPVRILDVITGIFVFEYSMELANAKSYPFFQYNLQNYGIGYYTPINCDDISIWCQYTIRPEFTVLQQIYTQAANANATTTFTAIASVPSNTVPSKITSTSTTTKQKHDLPPNFPRLDSFQWKVDSVPTSVQCPSIKIITTTTSSSSSSSSIHNDTPTTYILQQKNTYQYTVPVFVCLILMLYLLRQRNIRYQNYQYESLVQQYTDHNNNNSSPSPSSATTSTTGTNRNMHNNNNNNNNNIVQNVQSKSWHIGLMTYISSSSSTTLNKNNIAPYQQQQSPPPSKQNNNSFELQTMSNNHNNTRSVYSYQSSGTGVGVGTRCGGTNSSNGTTAVASSSSSYNNYNSHTAYTDIMVEHESNKTVERLREKKRVLEESIRKQHDHLMTY